MGSLSRWISLAALVVFGATSRLNAEVQSFSDFSGGLNTYQSSILLKENESPNLQNVLLDETGAITRRKGFSKLNSTAIGDGDDDVQAVYKLEQSDGDRYCVAFSSTSAYWSNDGCATFTVFISTLTRNNDVNCDAYGDNLYCVSNGYNFRFDGTNDSPVSGMPSSMKYIRVHRNRCFAAGGTSPSRLYWSNLGDCNTWTTGTDYVDIDAEDGDVITGIGEQLFNFLPIYKKYSSWLLQFDNANTANRKMINISKTIGGAGHRTIANFNNRQFFASLGTNGGQPGIYFTDGINIEEASVKVRGSLSVSGNFGASSGRKTVDSKPDFDAGTFDPYALSTSREPGLIQSSYTTITVTSQADFEAGSASSTLTTSSVSGSVIFSSSTFSIHNGGFETGSLSPWTCTDLGSHDFGTPTCEVSASGAISGSYGARISVNMGTCGAFCLGKNIDIIDNLTGATLIQKLTSLGGAQTFDLTSYSTRTLQVVFRVTDSETGGNDIQLKSSTFTALSRISFTTGEIGSDPFGWGTIDDFTVDRYFAFNQSSATGVFFKTDDMSISTPTWGLFSASVSSAVGTALTFQVQSTTATDGGGYEPVVSQTLGTEIGAAQRRYLRTLANFTTHVGTGTPILQSYTPTAASTGVWTSPELFLSNTVTTFGLFQTNQTTSGQEASIAYAVRTSTYAGGTAYAAKVVVSPGSSISASTGAYVVVIATYTVGVATETSKTDSILINWNEGTSARSATMAVYKNRLHYCAQSSSGTFNDTCFVLDRNGAWTRWSGVNARYLGVVNQNFVMGGSTETSGGFLYKLYDTDSDNGSAINAFWESKDLPLGKVQNIKSVDRVYLIHKPDATTLSVGLNADGGLRSQTYSVDLSTAGAFGVKSIKMAPPLNANSFRLKFSNNAASKPWEVQGFGLSYQDIGLMP